MIQPDLLELARLGSPTAIATWLNHELQYQGITVSVDREESRLSIGFHAKNTLNPSPLVTLVKQRLVELNNESIRSANVFGYQTGNPVPTWSHRIDLEDGSQDTVNPFQVAEQPLNAGATLVDMAVASPISSPESPAEDGETDGKVDRFLVCGLGSLGQYCVATLKKFALREFEVCITAIDKVKHQDWEVENLTSLLLGDPVIGDCRHDQVLLRAGVRDCRAIMLVTDNESDNIEAAIAARRLNPKIRLVVRSSRQILNELLKQQLGNFVAFEPTELPAAAFAMAGLQAGILGFFNIGDCRLQVIEQAVLPRDLRFDGFFATSMHKKNYRLLSLTQADTTEASGAAPAAQTQSRRVFYQWQPTTKVVVGDTIAFVEVVPQTASNAKPETATDENRVQQVWQWLQQTFQGNLGQKILHVCQWIWSDRTRRLIGMGMTTAMSLWILGTVLLWLNVAGISPQKAISSGFVLLLGGYGDVFGGLENDAVPWWVQFICLGITVVSLLFVLGVLGLIADNLLSSRFDFLRKRPIPKQNHVVIVGFGRVGQRVATLLQEFKQATVAITEQWENTLLPAPIPLVIGNPITELANVNLSTAKSLIVVTDDQMLNLEVALMARDAARQVDRDIGLVVRTYGQRFSDNLVNLLPDAKALVAYALSAEAFAGAAFGENILGLFRLNDQTVLVTEYHIGQNDTLVGKLLSQVAYGYSVVPIFHQRGLHPLEGDISKCLMPSDDRLLKAGDRFIVLSSINGLRRIERGEITHPRQWRLEAHKPLNESFILDIGNDLARISGCSIHEARTFVQNLPGAIELPLYDYQAHRLEQELNKQLPITLTPT